MKKELLKEGMKCKLSRQVDDAEGALYKNEVVTITEWTDISKHGDAESFVIYVVDEIGKHHTVGLNDIAPL